MKRMDELSMFFPAYNEIANLPKLVKSAKKLGNKVAHKYEIILIVHQNSNDGSIELAKSMARNDSKIKFVLQKRSNPGIGAAISMGFKTAKYMNMFYADSDNQFELNDFIKFLPYIEKFDVIAGYRIKREDPLARIITAKIYNMLVRLLFLVPQKDVDCAFRFVKKSVIKKIKIMSRYGLATTELLARARRNGFKIKQIGVNHYPRLHGKPVFEMGNWLNLPRPRVVLDLLNEIFKLAGDLYLNKG